MVSKRPGTYFLRCVLLSAFAIVFAMPAGAQDKVADSDPKLTGSVTYTLPQSVIDAEIGGRVVMSIRVDQTGKPMMASVAAGPMWPCAKNPTKELELLFSYLSETMLKLQFSPAIIDGKPVEKDIDLAFVLRNPKLDPKPIEVDFILGKPITQISAGIVVGKPFSLPKPKYPAEAREHGDSGKVSIQVLVDELGKVISAGAIDGRPRLQAAGREAACGGKFVPTLLDGKPIKVSGVLQYLFILP
jgi:hypothetical protein